MRVFIEATIGLKCSSVVNTGSPNGVTGKKFSRKKQVIYSSQKNITKNYFSNAKNTVYTRKSKMNEEISLSKIEKSFPPKN